jgi:hypothetical protein
MNDRRRYLYRKEVKGRRYLFFRYKGKLTPPMRTARNFGVPTMRQFGRLG